MGKQVILAVFIISVALGTEAEFQVVPVLLRAAANSAFMRSHSPFPSLHAAHIGQSAVNLLGRIAVHVPHSKKEKDEISQRKKSHHAISRMYDDSDPHQSSQHIDC